MLDSQILTEIERTNDILVNNTNAFVEALVSKMSDLMITINYTNSLLTVLCVILIAYILHHIIDAVWKRG